LPRENTYQAHLIKRLQNRFPGCLVLKNDEQYITGIPDLTLLWRDKYALLEVKRSEKEMDANDPRVATQMFYIASVVNMGGVADFIYPENEEEVLDAVQRAFESHR
jgi:hypothetical protein